MDFEKDDNTDPLDYTSIDALTDALKFVKENDDIIEGIVVAIKYDKVAIHGDNEKRIVYNYFKGGGLTISDAMGALSFASHRIAMSEHEDKYHG